MSTSCTTDSNSSADDIEDLEPNNITPIIPESSEPCDLTKKPKIDENLKKKYVVDSKIDSKNRNLSQLSNLEGGIPGTHSVFIKTWGCSHNWSDSEYMAGLLIKNGYKVSFDEEKDSLNSNIWILNSCTVKGRAQNLFESALKKAKSLNKYIIAAGCVPSGDKKNKLWSNISIIGVQQIDSINYVVQQTLNGNIVQLLKDKKIINNKNDKNNKKKQKAGGAPLQMPKLRRNKLEEIVPINTGCLNQCTYCKTKHARGDLGSYSIPEIVDRIRNVIINDNVRIINLESEDTGAYGVDIGVDIAKLLQCIEKEILNDDKLSRNIMLRLGISNPPYFLQHAKSVAKILKHPKVFNYIHIPVQSGANKVLYDMKRKYTIQEFEELCQIMVDEFDGIDNIHLCTDIIAGFPTETDESWKKTMNLVKKWKFTTMYMSPFFPRPGTPAAKMDYVFGDNHYVAVDRIKKERVREITKLFKTFEPFKKRLNTVQFWICNKGLTKDNIHYVGLNKYAEKILVKAPFNDCNLFGKIVEVYVTQCGQKYMYAKVCEKYIDLMQKYPEEVNYIELLKEKINDKKKKKNKFQFNMLHILTASCIAILMWYFVINLV